MLKNCRLPIEEKSICHSVKYILKTNSSSFESWLTLEMENLNETYLDTVFGDFQTTKVSDRFNWKYILSLLFIIGN